MTRNSLPFKVECKSTYVFFELIAGFNCETAALNYAVACAGTNPHYTYRVVKNGRQVLTILGTGEREA